MGKNYNFLLAILVFLALDGGLTNTVLGHECPRPQDLLEGRVLNDSGYLFTPIYGYAGGIGFVTNKSPDKSIADYHNSQLVDANAASSGTILQCTYRFQEGGVFTLDSWHLNEPFSTSTALILRELGVPVPGTQVESHEPRGKPRRD